MNKSRYRKDILYYKMYEATSQGRKRQSIWHKNHREQINKATQKYQKKCSSIMMWYFGYRCSQCGYSKDSRALQFDHIKGDGALDRKLHGAGSCMKRHYYNKPQVVMDKFQLLCANCNWIKKESNNENQGFNFD